jgi:hypothetical protein
METREILAEGGDKACRRRCNVDSITDRQSVDGYFGKFPCRHEHSCKTQRSWPSDSPCAGISLIVDDLSCRDLRRIADCGQSRMTIAAVTQLTLPCASFSRASSSRFSARVWRHCLRELQLMHTQNANLQMRIRSRRQALLPGHVAVMQADYALLGIGAGDRATRAAHRRRGRHPVNRCQRPQSIAARLSGSKPSERRRRARESLHKSLILFVFF